MNTQELKNESQKRVNNLLDECKVFFAFSNQQFTENKTELKEGEKYVPIGAGGYMPKSYVDTYLQGMKDIKAWEKKERKEQKESEKEKHILSELNNYECFYIGDIEDALPTLTQFYKRDYIQAVFNKYYDSVIETMY